MDYIDTWFSTVQSLIAVYVLVHVMFSIYSHNLRMKRGVGATPESSLSNIFHVTCLLLSILLYRSMDSKFTFGTMNGLIFLQILFTIGRNIRYYFYYKAKLRAARAEYRSTGKKSNLDIPGYKSLNTLMLGTLIYIIGFFCVGVAVYYGLVGLPESDPIHFDHFGDNNKLYL